MLRACVIAGGRLLLNSPIQQEPMVLGVPTLHTRPNEEIKQKISELLRQASGAGLKKSRMHGGVDPLRQRCDPRSPCTHACENLQSANESLVAMPRPSAAALQPHRA